MAKTAQELIPAWQKAWPQALALWSKFTMLREPILCDTSRQAAREGLETSFAMIRLADQAIIIDLEGVHRSKLEDYPVEILAHEIGHHVLAPADLADHARMIARMRWALPTREHLAEFVANLYTDLLINDRLQRSSQLRMADIYRVLGGGSANRMWTFYMRIYEILWALQKGSLTKASEDQPLEADAILAFRVIRSYARDWLDGAGRFAAICLSYLLQDDGVDMQQLMQALRDTQNAGVGGEVPAGLAEIEPGEKEGAIHPALEDEESTADSKGHPPPQDVAANAASKGQCREPFEYGEILKNSGINLEPHELAIRYYRERALPHLIPFPSIIQPQSSEPLAEGTSTWDVAQPIEDIDWIQTVIRSPRIVPGATTMERTWGVMEGHPPQREPMDLDLYVDSSGSMPNPQVATSYLALAGAIVTLSALRAGARVQATLWSGAHDYQSTNGFVQDAHELLEVLTGYIGGATAFPIHILRDTFEPRKPTDRSAHILIISDDGVTTLFDQDEKRRSGWEIARMALQKARGGGTMVLNLWQEISQNKALSKARQEGWNIYRVQTWEDVVVFAKEFSRQQYGQIAIPTKDRRPT